MKNKNDSIAKSGIWSVAGTFLVKGTYLITIPLFARLLSVAEYGEVNIFMTYASMFTIILSCYLTASVSTGVIKYQKNKSDFLASVMNLSLIIFALFFVIFQIFRTFFCRLLDLDILELNILLVYSFSLYIIGFNSSRLVMDYQYKKNALISFTALVLDTSFSIVFILIIFHGKNTLGRILGATIPNALVGVLIAAYILHKSKVWWNKTYWKFAIIISLPMIFHGLAHLVLGQADRIMIKRIIGATEAGIYGLVYNVALMMSALVEALNNVWIPWMFRKLEGKNYEEIRTRANDFILLFSVITITILSFTTEMIKILAPKEYWDGISLAIPIVISTFITFIYTLFVNIEIFYEDSKGIAIGTCSAALINIVLNYILLPVLGYKAAAYTTVTSYLLLLIFHYMICKLKLHKQIFEIKFIIKCIMFVVCYGLMVYFLLWHLIFRILILFLVLGIIYFRKKKLILALFGRKDK